MVRKVMAVGFDKDLRGSGAYKWQDGKRKKRKKWNRGETRENSSKNTTKKEEVNIYFQWAQNMHKFECCDEIELGEKHKTGRR